MQGLVLRNGVFYHRQRIPSDLRRHFGTRHQLGCSLRTSDWQAARVRVGLVIAKTEQLFSRMRSGMLSEPEIQQLVKDYLIELLNRSEAARVNPRSEGVEKWIKAPPKLIQRYLKEHRGALAEGDNEPGEVYAKEFVEHYGLDIQPGSADYQKLGRELTKAFAEFLRIEIERRQGNYGNDYDSIIGQLKKALEARRDGTDADDGKGSALLSAVIEKYIAEKSAHRWRDKTLRENKAMLALLVELVGDIPIRSIGHKLLLDMRNTLQRLPANRTKDKRYRGKSIKELLAMENVPPLDVTTVNNILGKMAAFFRWAEIHEHTATNPARSLLVPTPTVEHEERAVYFQDELQKIFNKLPKLAKPLRHPERLWVPLIAAYAPLRPDEISQLYVADVVQEDGVDCFQVTPDAGGTQTPDKKVKAPSGISGGKVTVVTSRGG